VFGGKRTQKPEHPGLFTIIEIVAASEIAHAEYLFTALWAASEGAV
jgi:hypothetical protein